MHIDDIQQDFMGSSRLCQLEDLYKEGHRDQRIQRASRADEQNAVVQKHRILAKVAFGDHGQRVRHGAVDFTGQSHERDSQRRRQFDERCQLGIACAASMAMMWARLKPLSDSPSWVNPVRSRKARSALPDACVISSCFIEDTGYICIRPHMSATADILSAVTYSVSPEGYVRAPVLTKMARQSCGQ